MKLEIPKNMIRFVEKALARPQKGRKAAQEKILKLLREIHSFYPNLRFGQMLITFVYPCEKIDFSEHDETLALRLECLLKELKKKVR